MRGSAVGAENSLRAAIRASSWTIRALACAIAIRMRIIASSSRNIAIAAMVATVATTIRDVTVPASSSIEVDFDGNVFVVVVLRQEFGEDVRASQEACLHPFGLDFDAFEIVAAAGPCAREFRAVVYGRLFFPDDDPVAVEVVDAGGVFDEVAGFEFVVHKLSFLGKIPVAWHESIDRNSFVVRISSCRWLSR
jgi:hypothetical protein